MGHAQRTRPPHDPQFPEPAHGRQPAQRPPRPDPRRHQAGVHHRALPVFLWSNAVSHYREIADAESADHLAPLEALNEEPAPAVTVQGELQESREYAQALEVELRDRTAKIERECKLAEAQVSRLLDMTNRMDDRLNALVSATEALGAMPEGYCFCSENRIGDDSKTHEPECEGLRSALRAIAGGGDE